MKDKNHAFLAGWGFSAKVWQVFHPEMSSNQCLNMPCFKDGNEESVLSQLADQLAYATTIHAWSHSGLWLLRLLQQNRIPRKESKQIVCYGLPLRWQLKDDAKKNAFIRQYELSPPKLQKKFLKLVVSPDSSNAELIEPYCLLQDPSHYQSQLNYLKWMFSFEENLSLPEALMLCKENNLHILLAENDAIVDSISLAQLFNLESIKKQSHLSLLEEGIE